MRIQTGVRKLFFALAVASASSGVLVPASSAERIRTAIPQANLNYLSVYVADAKGFFRDVGLENETVATPGPTGVAALMAHEVDYYGGGGSSMRAAMKGAPVKAIMFQTEKVTWYLAAGPGITGVRDLKGKKIAVGVIGDTYDTLTTMLAERHGLSGRDITRIAIGPNPAAALAAIKAGAVSAGALDPATSVIAEKEGVRVLTFLGDLFPFPFQGFVTTDRKIAENPAQIKRWLRAMVRALMFLRDNTEEAADIGMRKIPGRFQSREIMVEGLKRYLKAMPDGVPGMPSAEGIKNVLEYDVRIPIGFKEEIPPAKVLNFKFIAEVVKEFESKGAAR